MTEEVTGFKRLVDNPDPLCQIPQATLILRSIPQNFGIWLSHNNYNPVELAKTRPLGPRDTMVNRGFPLGFLQWMTYIDANDFATIKTQARAWAWAQSVSRQRIFIIDRNDFYKSNPVLREPDMMKVVKVRIMHANQPESPDYFEKPAN